MSSNQAINDYQAKLAARMIAADKAIAARVEPPANIIEEMHMEMLGISVGIQSRQMEDRMDFGKV